jgi:hypothetical protein
MESMSLRNELVTLDLDCCSGFFSSFHELANLWENTSLGSTAKKPSERWKIQQPNHFFGPFPLNVFTTINYDFVMSIHCKH